MRGWEVGSQKASWVWSIARGGEGKEMRNGVRAMMGTVCAPKPPSREMGRAWDTGMWPDWGHQMPWAPPVPPDGTGTSSATMPVRLHPLPTAGQASPTLRGRTPWASLTVGLRWWGHLLLTPLHRPWQPGRGLAQHHGAGGLPDDGDRAGLGALPGRHQGRALLRQPQPRLPAAAAGLREHPAGRGGVPLAPTSCQKPGSAAGAPLVCFANNRGCFACALFITCGLCFCMHAKLKSAQALCERAGRSC